MRFFVLVLSLVLGGNGLAQDAVLAGVNAVVPASGPVQALALWEARGLKAAIADGRGQSPEQLARDGVLRLLETHSADYTQLPHLLEYVIEKKELLGGEYGLAAVSYGTLPLAPKNGTILPVANILPNKRVLIDGEYWGRMTAPVEQAGVYIQLALSLTTGYRAEGQDADMAHNRAAAAFALTTFTADELKAKVSASRTATAFKKAAENPPLLKGLFPGARTIRASVRSGFQYTQALGFTKARELALADFAVRCQEWKDGVRASALKAATDYLYLACGHPEDAQMGTGQNHGLQMASTALVFFRTKTPSAVLHHTIRGAYTLISDDNGLFSAAQSALDACGNWEREMRSRFKDALFVTCGARERKNWELEAAYGGDYRSRISKSVQYFSVGTVILSEDPSQKITASTAGYRSIKGTVRWPAQSGVQELAGVLASAESQWRAACDAFLKRASAEHAKQLVYATCESDGSRFQDRQKEHRDSFSIGYVPENLVFSSQGTVYLRVPRS